MVKRTDPLTIMIDYVGMVVSYCSVGVEVGLGVRGQGRGGG